MRQNPTQDWSWLGWVLVTAGILTYYSSVSSPFVFSDVQEVKDLEGLSGDASQYWRQIKVSNRPVLMLSFVLNFVIGGNDPRGYHLFNLAIHLLAAITLFGVIRQTIPRIPLSQDTQRSATTFAFCVSLLWLVHPLQTESVTYIYQRSESMAGLSILLSIYCLIRSVRGRRWLWYALALFASIMGMATKEVALVIPVLLIAYDYVFLSRDRRTPFRLYGAISAVGVVVFGALTLHLLFDDQSSVGFGARTASALNYGMTQPAVILHYLRLALWPSPLCLDYAWPLTTSLSATLPFFAVILGLLGLTAYFMKRRSWLGFIGTWFFVILAPSSSFVPIMAPAAEHRMYLPLAAVIVVAGAAVQTALRHLGRREKLGAKLLIVSGMAILLATMTVRRNADYRSLETIWGTVVAVAPHNSRGHFNLANSLVRRGKREEAVAHFEQAAELQPNDAEALIRCAGLLFGLSRFEEAASYFRAAVKVWPESVRAHCGLGSSLVQVSDIDGAMEQFAIARKLNPDSPVALEGVARCLALHPDPARVNGAESLRLAARAAELTGSRNIRILETLALGYSLTGQAESAFDTVETILALSPKDRPRYLNLLDAYRKQRPSVLEPSAR